MILLIIGSNLSTITAILGRRKKLSRMYFFLLHLCVADLLTAFTSMLPELTLTLTNSSMFYGGDALCRIVKFVQMIAPNLRLVDNVMQELLKN